MNDQNDTMTPERDERAADSALRPAACSLVDCPPGKMTAKLPYFRDKPLPVEVDHWKTLDGKHQEKTVSLLQGSIKNRYLSDTELEGAEFYPENAEHKRGV